MRASLSTICRLKLSQTGTVQQPVLTRTQTEILEIVSKVGQVLIEEFRDRVDDLRILLARGYLRLRVETNEWGISFELVPNQDDHNSTTSLEVKLDIFVACSD
jgi:hypothetical protein